jgi:hypothetical protein
MLSLRRLFDYCKYDRADTVVWQDDPKKLAEVVIEFWRRNERVVPGVKKVGEI